MKRSPVVGLAQAIPAALLVALWALAAGYSGSGTAAQIIAFQPSEGFSVAGSPAHASVSIENTSGEDQTFSVGYSVRGPTGEWHDAPPSTVALAAGDQATTDELRTDPLETAGYYDSRVSVWSGDPGQDFEAERLADVEVSSTFRVYSSREDFDAPELNAGRWGATTRDLGRGGLAPENLGLEDGLLRLTLPAGTLNGSGIESKDLHGPGFYAARIKAPNAPSSITGFFLYSPPDFESEVDVEIYNDTSGRIIFTTYSDGEQTHTQTTTLPFDPTGDFHDYAFFYDEESAIFYVDGEPMQEYEGGLPDERMNLYVNTWFPTWLDGEEPESDRNVYVDRIER